MLDAFSTISAAGVASTLPVENSGGLGAVAMIIFLLINLIESSLRSIEIEEFS